MKSMIIGFLRFIMARIITSMIYSELQNIQNIFLNISLVDY